MVNEKEVDDVRKLIWKLFAIGTSLMGVIVLIIVLLFSHGNKVNAQQDVVIAQKAGDGAWIRYEATNIREHTEIKQNQRRFEDKVDKRFDRLENNMKADMTEIKELLKK